MPGSTVVSLQMLTQELLKKRNGGTEAQEKKTWPKVTQPARAEPSFELGCLSLELMSFSTM